MEHADASWSCSYTEGEETHEQPKGYFCHIPTSQSSFHAYISAFIEDIVVLRSVAITLRWDWQRCKNVAVYSRFLKEKSSALISSILYTLIDGCYSDRQRTGVLNLMNQEHSCSHIESVCLEALGAVSVANYTHEKATVAACHCAKHANYHALCYAVLSH